MCKLSQTFRFLYLPVDPLDVVVGGADELEEALFRVLPQHPGACEP